jgi:H+/Cl- antiporter ClcA
MSAAVDENEAPSARTQLALAVPSVVIGVVCALLLFAEITQHAIWHALPEATGIDPASPAWIIGVLTLTGLAVGLSVQFLPGHGGRDSATTELIAPPISLLTVPSLVLVTVLGLAGGVSLGPENPVIAINTGILVALIARLWRGFRPDLVVMITAAGTIGALFGTPVAAALIFTGVVAKQRSGGALWDRLFLPLVGAGAGAITMSLLAQPSFAIDLGAYTRIAPIDIVSAMVIGCVGALLGLVGAAVFPSVHAAFRLLRKPAVYVTLGGLALGILGALGGEITLFKGLSQMAELATNREEYSAGQLVVIIAIKIVALIISAACGFRGGRIFPAIFVGAALGILANALFPDIPLPVAVAAGTLGLVLAIGRDGWIALFAAVAITGGVTVLPLLCVAILPVWLLVSRGPEMIVKAPDAAPPAEKASARDA